MSHVVTGSEQFTPHGIAGEKVHDVPPALVEDRKEWDVQLEETPEFAEQTAHAEAVAAAAEIADMPVASPEQPATNPPKQKARGPLPPAISLFKTMVRVARATPGYPTPDSFKLALQQSLAVLPWMSDHYREVRGEPLRPELYTTRIAKLARYADGKDLSARKRAEIRLARLLLAGGEPVAQDELPAWLEMAMRSEKAAAAEYKRAMAATPTAADATPAAAEVAPVPPGEVRVVFAE